MSSKTSSYRQSLLDGLSDPREASAYLNAALEDSDESFLKALRNVAQARQMAKVAKDAGVQRETLYRSLSSQGNPRFETLSSILRAVGLRISIDEERIEATPPLPASQPPIRASSQIQRNVNEEEADKYPLAAEPNFENGGYAALFVEDESLTNGNLMNYSGASQYAGICGSQS